MLWALIALRLIEFTGPDGQLVVINADEIVSLRSVRATDHFGPGIQCLIFTVDGKNIGVKETCEQVRETIHLVDPQ
jgi:hypothetical protein